MGLKMVQRIFQLIVLVENLVTETMKRKDLMLDYLMPLKMMMVENLKMK